MNWLKTVWGALGAGVLAFIAVWFAKQAKDNEDEAEKWKKRYDEEKSTDVDRSVHSANVALAKAKEHSDKANEKRDKVMEKIDGIAKKGPDMASIVSGWKSDRLK